ncbi:MAG: arginine--tRNA ligase [Candidatus Omnitrophica bacterium]|nr:arginine--tRNA ligase [Candidatus Omnitrophota bacterium]
MKNDIQQSLRTLIADALRDLAWASYAGDDLYLDLPTDPRFGDLSSNVALRLSKALRKPPREIASSIVENITKQLKQHALKDSISEVKVEGAGFINFYFSNLYLLTQLKQLLAEGSNFFRSSLGENERVLIEFVSANPTGALSVAHARQAAVGDILANILSFIGFAVQREYYLNDEGNQINILGNSTALRIKELQGETIEFPENYYQGDYIYDIAREAKKRGVAHDALGDFAAGYILDIIKQELDDFKVKFDCWFSQKELRTSGKIEQVFRALKEKGFLYEEGGAQWFKSTAFGDDKDRVVVKSDGSYTYLAPDIAYHQEKYRRGFQWLINLWGPDHHGYINRLKASVEAFGHKPDSLSIVIVQLASIFRDGKIVEMSTRKGQYITLREVLDEVGVDAARFFFVMRRTSSHLDFDLEVAKKQTAENPVYYVQYAHARICSIMRNLKEQGQKDNKSNDTDLSVIKEAQEIALIKKIMQFPSMLFICYKTVDPFMLTVYLQELAESFHKFYDAHRVISSDERLTQARLCLIDATRTTLACGLELLGISRPEKM